MFLHFDRLIFYFCIIVRILQRVVEKMVIKELLRKFHEVMIFCGTSFNGENSCGIISLAKNVQQYFYITKITNCIKDLWINSRWVVTCSLSLRCNHLMNELLISRVPCQSSWGNDEGFHLTSVFRRNELLWMNYR